MIRARDQVNYQGAIYALQKQSGFTVLPGGRTALSLLGKTHYLELVAKWVTVFGSKGEKLPVWFKKHDWGVTVDYHQVSFLPPDIGLKRSIVKNGVYIDKYKITVPGELEKNGKSNL